MDGESVPVEHVEGGTPADARLRRPIDFDDRDAPYGYMAGEPLPANVTITTSLVLREDGLFAYGTRSPNRGSKVLPPGWVRS